MLAAKDDKATIDVIDEADLEGDLSMFSEDVVTDIDERINVDADEDVAAAAADDTGLIDENTSFLTSFNDSELIDFISKLSQAKRQGHVGKNREVISDDDDDDDVDSHNTTANIIDNVTSSLDSKTKEDTVRNSNGTEENVSFQLAQSKPKINQDITELQQTHTGSSLASSPSQETQVFGDYASYFETKSRNQQKQDEEYLLWENQRLQATTSTTTADNNNKTGPPPPSTTSEILKGCTIHVNGHTRPNIHTLHRLIVLNGGKFLHHLSSKGQVTHIIAERLTPRKLKEFKNCKVVKPQWILECLKSGKIVDWVDFSVIAAGGYGQGRLQFARQEEEESLPVVEEDEDHDQRDAQDQGQYVPGGIGKEVVLSAHESANDAVLEDVDLDVDLDVDVDVEAELRKDDADVVVGLDLKDEENEEELKDLNETDRVAIDSKHPDFLKTFFQKSRLHHLSAWKSELRYEFLQKLQRSSQQQKSQPHPTKPRFTNSPNFKIILHIDFDSFFATVSSLSRPDIDFITQPVCVTHATGDLLRTSTADVSSCNYAARAMGVKNGMWVKTAIALCPGLVCVGYDFPGYERVSRIFYEVLGACGAVVYPVSVDEALLDVSDMVDENAGWEEDVRRLCHGLKEEIWERTRCGVSVGCSKNVLLAKLALLRAKPDGIVVKFDGVEEWIGGFRVLDLPGVGASIEFKLGQYLKKKSKNKESDVLAGEKGELLISDLRQLSMLELQEVLGSKNGTKLYQYTRGVDNTSVIISPGDFIQKSISIDINWGIRFDNIEQVDKFIFQVTQEIARKLQRFNLVCEQISLKVLKRAKDAPVEPPKYLGCGLCDSFSKLTNLGVASDDYRSLGNEVRSLYRFIGCEPHELRGVGITVSKLVDKSKVNRQQRLNFSKVGEFRKKISEQVVEPVESVVQPVEGPAPEPEEEEVKNTSMTQFAIPSDLDSSVLKELPSSITRNIELQRIRNSTIIESVPSQIDVSVLRELPLEIQTELKAELRRRNLTSCSPLGRNNNNNSNNNSYLQPVFTSDKSATKYVRVLKRSPKKSPRKKVSPVRGGGGGVRINERDAARAVESSEEVKQLDEVVDMKLDEDVLKELPSSLREDIIREYREYQTHQQLFKSPKRRIEFNVNKEKEELVVERDFYSLLDAASCLHSDVFVFQKRGNIKEIISLLKDWIAHTRVNGPNAKDLDMLERYLDSLRVGGKQFFAVHKKRYYRTLIIQELSRMLTVEKEEGGISEKWMRFLDRINDL